MESNKPLSIWVGMEFRWKHIDRVDVVSAVSDFPYQFKYKHTFNGGRLESEWLSVIHNLPLMEVSKDQYIKKFKELYGQIS